MEIGVQGSLINNQFMPKYLNSSIMNRCKINDIKIWLMNILIYN